MRAIRHICARRVKNHEQSWTVRRNTQQKKCSNHSATASSIVVVFGYRTRCRPTRGVRSVCDTNAIVGSPRVEFANRVPLVYSPKRPLNHSHHAFAHGLAQLCLLIHGALRFSQPHCMSNSVLDEIFGCVGLPCLRQCMWMCVLVRYRLCRSRVVSTTSNWLSRFAWAFCNDQLFV